jgi:osmotically-inducible protein OsmY
MHKTESTAKRADAEIAREIRRRLQADFEVPDQSIRVEVTDGLVTIEGFVNSSGQRDATERCVREVQGVTGVTNRIAIPPNGQDRMTP